MNLRDNLNVSAKTTKCTTFSVPTKNEVTKIGKEDNETVETIPYKIKFVDGMRFMASSLSNLFL